MVSTPAIAATATGNKRIVVDDNTNISRPLIFTTLLEI
jgi:hypothetical protein